MREFKIFSYLPPISMNPILPLKVMAGLLGFLLAAGNLHAAEWTIAPEIEVGSHYDDNATLAEGDDRTIVIWGGILDVAALAQRRTERSTIRIRPRLFLSEYPGDDEESSDDQFLDFLARSEGLRSEWSLTGNFSREKVIQGESVDVEFPDPDIENPDVGETGVLGVERRRTLWRVAPTFSYEVTERTDAGIGLNYLDVSYDDESAGEALDYTDTSAQLFLVRQLTEDSRVRLTLFASEYEVDDISNESSGYGLKAQYDRDISETFSMFLNVGIQETDVKASSGSVDDSASTYLFNAGFQRRWELTRVRGEVGHNVQPSGTGFLRETTRARLNLYHQFRPRWYGEIGAIALQTESVAIDDIVAANDRDYYQLRAALGYEWTRAWRIEVSVGHTFQDYEDEPGDADANEAFLTFVYRPRGMVWSR